jgi:hypothetical protein
MVPSGYCGVTGINLQAGLCRVETFRRGKIDQQAAKCRESSFVHEAKYDVSAFSEYHIYYWLLSPRPLMQPILPRPLMQARPRQIDRASRQGARPIT